MEKPKHILLLEAMVATIDKTGRSKKFSIEDIENIACSKKPSDLVKKLKLLDVNIKKEKKGSWSFYYIDKED